MMGVTLFFIYVLVACAGVVFPYRLIMALESPPDTEAEGILSQPSYDAMTYTLKQLTERYARNNYYDLAATSEQATHVQKLSLLV